MTNTPRGVARAVTGHGRWAMSLLFLTPVLLVLPAASALTPPALAASVVELDVAVGHGGWVVPGVVTPVRVEVQASAALEGTLVVDVPPVRGGPSTLHVSPLRLVPGGRQQVYLDVIVQDPRRPLVVTIRGARGDLLRREVLIGAARVVEGIVAALTHDAAGLEFLLSVEGRRRPAYVTEADLPVRWQAFDGVELLIVRDVDPRAILPAQQRAIVEWVAQGGTLLVVAPQRLDLTEVPWLRRLLPLRGQRRYGRGTVAEWPDDIFAPGIRGRADVRAGILALLKQRRPPAVLDGDLVSILPATRPLPGATQFGLAALSVLYVVAVRVALRRFGARRGGWLVIAGLVIASGGALYTFAAGARRAATSIVQVSVAEALDTLPQARVTTYASLLAPYGGRYVLRLPEGGAGRPLDEAAVTFADGGREVRGAVATGQVSLIVRQVVPFELRARFSPPDALIVDPAASLRGGVLYRERQVYRLPAEGRGPLRLDPGRWEPVDRSGILDGDLAARAIAVLVARLDQPPDRLWLIARVTDERLPVRLPGGGQGEAVVLAVVEVR